MFAELILGATVAAADHAALPSLHEALRLLRLRATGAEVREVGEVPLAGFNFYQRVDLGRGGSALVISTLWKSGLFLYDGHGRGVDYMPMAEVLRLWAVDLDGDGTMELLTDERVGRGTGFRMHEFRLYRAAGHLKRVWSADSLHTEAPWSPEGVRILVDRQSFVRILNSPTPHLEYREPCGRQECIKELFMKGDSLVEDAPR